MRPLRIGVNALYLIPGQVGGTEIYLRNLLRALAAVDLTNEYYVFTNAETGGDLSQSGRMRVLTQEVRATNRPMRLVWEQTKLPMQARRLGLDCLLNPGFTAPIVTACPNVTVFHDLQHKRHPEYFRWFDLPAWNFFLWAAVRRSQVLIAVSEATKADLMRYYGLPASRIRVVHHGVEDMFFDIGRRRAGTEPILLCTSTSHPHKNLDRLIRAFERFRSERNDFRLIITGVRGFAAQELEKLASDGVEMTGWIPRAELYDLFRRAHAFVYPTTFEGFGLPVIEAMAAGIPLVCSDIEPLRTLARGAALRFDPADTDGLVQALERIVSDQELRERLTRAGRERAATFTWEQCARDTLDAIYEATGAGLRVESSRQSAHRGI
jgi:glycosyltransferase involved in cell wall biosynthesis